MPVKVFALTTEGVENASCEFDVATLSPTYRLLIGVPGKSNAFAISRKLGLPSYIIDDASSRIDANDIHFEDLLTDLENSRITIEKEQAEIKEYKDQIRRLKAEAAAKSQTKISGADIAQFNSLIQGVIQQEVVKMKVICENSEQAGGRYKTHIVVEVTKASVLTNIVNSAKSDEKLKANFEEGKFKQAF